MCQEHVGLTNSSHDYRETYGGGFWKNHHEHTIRNRKKDIHHHRKITVHIDIEREQLRPSKRLKIPISSYVSVECLLYLTIFALPLLLLPYARI